MPRHEIPTHLNVEDRVVLGLSLRQALYLAGGLSAAYGFWSEWPALPPLVRGTFAATCLLLAAAVALVRPGGRGLDEWAFAVLHYAAVPRRAAWRRRAPPPAAAPAPRDSWRELPAELLWGSAPCPAPAAWSAPQRPLREASR